MFGLPLARHDPAATVRRGAANELDEQRQPAAPLDDGSIRDRAAVSPAIARLLLSDTSNHEGPRLRCPCEHESRARGRRSKRPRIRQNRASSACRLAANDRVEAVVGERLDMGSAAGGRRSRPSTASEFRSLAGCSHELDAGRTPDGCHRRTNAATTSDQSSSPIRVRSERARGLTPSLQSAFHL
jgi:hypothetical protein